MAYQRDLRYLSREMRRRRTAPSRVLDLSATLAATLRRGGLPALMFGTRAEPEYLVLVDRTGFADHQACLADEVVEFFHAEGVCMNRYVFDGDPRFCRHNQDGMRALHMGPQSLELLFSRYPDARLVIFSDGSGLSDRYTGAPAAWLKTVLMWKAPLLLTPQPRRMWGLRERQLKQAGLTVLSLDGEGFSRFSDILRNERSAQEVPPLIRADGGKTYQRDIDLLLDRNPLTRDRLAALLTDLRRDLGPDGLAWLAACAVYPEVHWAVTLAVGDALHPGRRNVAFATRLAQISRLPWMRVGYMPDWLRAALLTELMPKAERKVRACLEALLSRAKTQGSETRTALTLSISTTTPHSPWRDAKAGLMSWIRGRPRPGNIRDAIFLRFLSGPRSRLAVDASDMLVRLFFRKRAPLAGPRAWPLLTGIVVAAVTGYQVPPIQRIASSPTPNQDAPPIVTSPTGDFADPFVLVDDGTYYAYAANANSKHVQLLYSNDLRTWKALPDAMPALATWVRKEVPHVWSPEVIQIKSRYVLYYTAHDVASDRQCVGAAVSDSPTGPFVDAAKAPLVCQVELGGTIDASPLLADGRLYLYFKNDGNCCKLPTALFAQELRPDGLGVVGQPVSLLTSDATWERNVVEAPSMVVRDGKYILLYSAGEFGDGSYAVGYATCAGPLGPCQREGNGPFLKSKDEAKLFGPGHASVFRVGTQDYIVYHAWELKPDGKRGDRRFLYIDTLDWLNGKPVVKGTTLVKQQNS